jgi:EAL domain-containing protein (putative c-di-GMP-specific phosphodiesterase class I)
MPERQASGLSIAARVIAALRQDEFVLYSQEIRPALPGSGQRPFQEILLRFRQEEERLLPPGSFFSSWSRTS